MTNNVVLGFDTSNYTTSVAVITEEGELVANIKRPLPVKEGERGLRQSDALFAHIKNLPSAVAEAREYLSGKNVLAVGVSERPRRLEGSYMPCFLAGVSAAEAAAASAGAPLYKFSHQCGHIMAALYSSGELSLASRNFAAFHVSGGTTELLSVHPDKHGFYAEHIGGTNDLNAGQVIDRIGVAMGLPFPAGRHLEELALSFNGKIVKKKISRDGLFINLSGLENMAMKLYEKNADKAQAAAFVFDYIGDALAELCREYIERTGEDGFVFAGGVMCNSIIKRKLSSQFCAYFAEPQMSSDNAVGIAYLALNSYKNSGVGD